MNLTPIQKRAVRKQRNKTDLDMNLVALIDIFTILIFFLLSSATEVETLPSYRAVKLPESTADTQPRETIVVVVSGSEIVVDGRKVADVADVMKASDDVIPALKAELELLNKRQVIREKNRVVVQGVNFIKRHTRPNPQRNIKGGIAEREAALHVSNVMLVDPESDKRTRVKSKVLEDGQRVRVAKSGALLDK